MQFPFALNARWQVENSSVVNPLQYQPASVKVEFILVGNLILLAAKMVLQVVLALKTGQFMSVQGQGSPICGTRLTAKLQLGQWAM